MAIAVMSPETCKELFEHPVVARMAQLDLRQFTQFVTYVFERAGYSVSPAVGLQGADLLIRAGTSNTDPVAAVVQVRDGSVDRVARAGIDVLQRSLQFVPGAVGYVVTPNGFAHAAYDQTVPEPRVSLIDGEHFLRYIKYVKGSRLHPSTASSIAPDHILRADTVRRRPVSQTKVLTLANNKGGVGKTTTALNLAFDLARPEKPDTGRHVLLVDMDAQANLSRSLRDQTANGASVPSLTDYFMGRRRLGELVHQTRFANLWLIPADSDLHLTHADMGGWPQTELQFVSDLHHSQLRPPNVNAEFDWIILDTAPAMSLHTRAAVAAAHYVLAPASPSAFADPGLNNLFDTIDAMHALMGSEARMLGCVVTQWENKAVYDRLLTHLKDNILPPRGIPLLRTKIPHDSKVDEAHLELGRGIGKLIFGARGAAAAYAELVEEVLNYVNNA